MYYVKCIVNMINLAQLNYFDKTCLIKWSGALATDISITEKYD